MLHSQDRKSTSELASRTVIRVSVVLGLLIASVMALTSGWLRPVTADSSRSTANMERSNHRISIPGSAAAPKTAVTSTRLGAPLVTIDVDRTDDNAGASACTASANDCSLRGAIAFANLNPGTMINVPSGTYLLNIPGGAGEGFSGNNSIGDVDVRGNNTSISGDAAATTIIQQTQPNDRVLEVNPDLLANFNFAISGVTITGGKETTAVGGGGIIAGSIDNTTSVTNCVISGNSATGSGTLGGGGIQTMGGSLTLTGTTFSSNSTSTSGGGLSYTAGDPLNRRPSNGTLSVSGSSFSSNTANSLAAGGGGADLFNFNGSIGAYNINSSSFSGNTASTGSGGAIIVETGPLTLSTSSLSGNSAGFSGGAISSSGSLVVNYSRFVGNTVPTATNGLSIFTTNGSVTADDNWWGTNTGASANEIRTSTGSISPLTYLQLRASASPNEICAGQSSTITADIKQRNAGEPLTTELNGLPAFPVPPTTIFSNAVLGTLSGASTQFVNGSATATYTAGGTQGMGSVDAAVDNEVVTATITISANSTTDPADVSVCQGQDANFSTTASGPGPFTYAWTVDGSPAGTTSSIIVPTGSLSVGSHTVAVTVTGACGMVSQSATLTVQTPTTTTDPADVAACSGQDANFSTTASGTGPFSYAWTLDGNPVGGNSPNVTIPTGALSPGNHTVQVTTTGACGSAVQTATLTVGGVPIITVSTTTVSVWPPNHAYQTFNVADFVASASSTCDPNVDVNDVVIVNVSSDEPEDSLTGDDGITSGDIVIAANCKSVNLRRERDGNLNGRVYTITFKVTDSFGNSTTATVKVTVPISQSGGPAVDDGPGGGYTVISACGP